MGHLLDNVDIDRLDNILDTVMFWHGIKKRMCAYRAY